MLVCGVHPVAAAATVAAGHQLNVFGVAFLGLEAVATGAMDSEVRLSSIQRGVCLYVHPTAAAAAAGSVAAAAAAPSWMLYWFSTVSSVCLSLGFFLSSAAAVAAAAAVAESGAAVAVAAGAAASGTNAIQIK